MQSPEELEENLLTYRAQLEQVNQLLEQEPENEEYKEMAAGLVEVIELTQDLLSSAQQHLAQQAPPAGSEANLPAPAPHLADGGGQAASAGVVPGTGPSLAVPEAAAPALRLEAGAQVQAVWSGDSEWRDGVVDAVTKSGYMVRFSTGVGDGSQLQEVREMRVRRAGEDEEEVRQRAREALAAVERDAETQRMTLKRKMEEAAKKEIQPLQVPAKLKIKPEDSEEVKAEKKRKIHAIKSKQRLENLELMQNKKQNAWQQFQQKGKQKKPGFFTGKKKDSIFKSPEDVNGKVGVVGSGKGMTDFQSRGKHTNLKLGEDDEEEP